MTNLYDPREHKIKKEEKYSSPYGEITIQEVETCRIPTCTWIHYRTTLGDKELAWGENRDRVLAKTLLTLLKPTKKEEQQ